MRLLPPLFAMVLSISAFGNSLELEIKEGVESLTPIAVVPFKTSNGAFDISPIVHRDMARSGQFLPIEPELMLNIPTSPEEVIFRDWQTQQIEYVILGEASRDSLGNYAVTFHMVDVTQEQLMKSVRLMAPASEFRDLAHQVADISYEQLTGVRGAFSTKLLYVIAIDRGQEDALYRLEIADSDGENARVLVTSENPILAPVWSPDGSMVAYVSFETGSSAVFTHDLITGERRAVANFEGVNSAPSFSPDGTRLALALSRDGNPELYTLDLNTGVLRRITSHRAIDTEPVWSNDGEELIFTSDRGGGPQLYKVSLRSLLPKRLTFVGDYNARPRVLPEEDRLIYVHRDNRDYHIVWQNLNGDTRPRILTSNALDESPSVAPNGMMVIYATKRNEKGILAIVSVDGDFEFFLPAAEGDALEPAWSPFLKAANVESVDL